jgi:hypothetical protein
MLRGAIMGTLLGAAVAVGIVLLLGVEDPGVSFLIGLPCGAAGQTLGGLWGLERWG